MKLTRVLATPFMLTLLLTPGPLQGQDQTPSRGIAEFGFRHAWGDVYGRPDLPFTPNIFTSKFNEYSDTRNGFYLRRFEFTSNDVLGSKYYVGLQSRSAVYKNQSYLATFGEYGKFKIQFRYDEIPHIYTNTARTLYTETSPGVYTLPLALKTALQTQSTNGTAAKTLPYYMVTQVVCGAPIPPATQPPACNEQFVTPQILRKAGTATFMYYLRPEWTIYGMFSRENQVGSRPIGLLWNSSPSASATAGAGAEVPEPIDYFTNNVKAGTEYSHKDAGVIFEYAASIFQDNITQMVVDNPFRATNEDAADPLRGQMALYPHNHAQYLNVAGAFDVTKYLRVMADVNPGWLSQNEPFVPYTTNSAINTCGTGSQACSSLSVLPASSANAAKQTLAMNYRLVTLPWKNFQIKADYRHYDYNNHTPVHNFTPSQGDVGVPSVGSPTANTPYGYNKKTYEVTANWFFAKSSSLKAGYQGEMFDRTYRDVEHSVENAFISALDLSPRKDLRFRVSYRRSDRNPSAYQDDNASDPATGNPVACTSTSAVFTADQRCNRRFDEASRLLNRVDGDVEYDVGRFSFDGNYQTTQLNFNRPGGVNSPTPLNFLTGSAATTSPYYLYGALKDVSFIYSADVNFTISPAASLFAEFTHETYHKRMVSRNRTPTTGAQTILTCTGCDSANDDWESSYRDISDTYAAGIDLYLGKKFYLTPYYSLSAGKGNVLSRALGDPSITTGANAFLLTGTSMPQNYPETTTRIHEVAVVFKYRLRNNILPKLEYRYQQFDNRDFQTTVMSPYMGCIGTTASPVTGCPSAAANVAIPQPASFYPGFVVGDNSAARFIFLGADQPSYRVSVLTATLEFFF